MSALLKKNYLTVLKTVEALSNCRSLEELKTATLETLFELLACNTISFNDIDLELETDDIVLFPKKPELAPFLSNFESLMEEHPVMTYMKRTGDGTAWKISDFVSQTAFRKLELYKQVYAATDTEFQMAISFQPKSRRMIGIACNRGRADKDFTERDRELLNLLRPHLINLWGIVIDLDTLKNGNSPPSMNSALSKVLTVRERQVLDWISEGKTNVQIAHSMGVSALTVKTHSQKILRKLGARNRPHAVRMVFGNGM